MIVSGTRAKCFPLICLSPIAVALIRIFYLVQISCYEWLLCWLLDSTAKAMHISTNNGLNRFEARNDAQVYKARDLSRAFAEYYALLSCYKRVCQPDVGEELKPILHLLLNVYGLWTLEKHLPTFYQGCFATGDGFADTVRSELVRSCREMKDSAVSIADSLAPPDFALNSVIGKSDGLVMNLILFNFFHIP